jgi:predicted MFS family arabinose efflux permease
VVIAPAQKPQPPSEGMLLLLALAGFTTLASMRICDAMLPALAQAFRASITEAAIVITSFATSYCVMLLVCGVLADRFGKLMVVVLCTVGCALATLGAAVVPSLAWLALARAGMGAAAAGIVAVAIAWIGDTVPMDRRQAVLARYMGITVSGIVLGTWTGGFLTELLGWRGTFAVIALLFGACAMLLWRRADLAAAPAPASAMSVWRHAAKLLGSPWARWVLGCATMEGVFAFGTLPFLPSILHTRFELSLAHSGAVLALFGVGGLIYGRVAGWLLRRMSVPALARLGGILLCLGFALLAWMPNWKVAATGCCCAGLGYYTFHNTLQVQATQLSNTARGLSVSMFGFFFFLGQSIGVPSTAEAMKRAAPAWCYGASALVLLGVAFVYAHQVRRRPG